MLEKSNLKEVDSLVKVWYYGLTTLTTIGYGDFSPVSYHEKLIVAVILMIAVGVFSIIMSHFLAILEKRNDQEQTGEGKDLSKWVALLTKFNAQQPLAKKLILRIEDYFEFYWNNNPLLAFKKEGDQRFLDELPVGTVQSIFIDFLFKDFLYKFNDLFELEINIGGTVQKLMPSNYKWREFMVIFLNTLEPRLYTDLEEIVQDQYEEVHEVLFITKGSILVGYRLFKEGFWAKLLKNRAIVGAFPCMTNKVSEFMYKPMEIIQGFAIKKHNFNEILQNKVGHGMKAKFQSYYSKLRQIVYAHRELEARKFKTRIDYVDLSAYGVNVNYEDTDYHMEDSKKIDDAIKKYTNPYHKLTSKLESLDAYLTRILYCLCALAKRYDEKMDKMISSFIKDAYQRELMMKTYETKKYKDLQKIIRKQETFVEF